MTEPIDHPEAAARLAAIVESSDDAIVSKTLDGVITSWNGAAQRIFGYTSAEAIGRHISLIIPPDRLEEENAILASIRAGQPIKHLETIRVAKDGRQVAVSLTVSPIKNPSGQIVGASKVARDISDRRRGEITQARLAAIIESSDDAIVSKTLDGIITSWNGGAERMFGWTAAEAVGQSITLIIPEEQREEENRVLARLRLGERITHFETVRQRKDGRLLDVSITVSPIRDGSGAIVGASKVARDISSRRLLDQARQTLLERERLGRIEAEALNRSKDQFLATLSHELRTPLNAIYGWARMLEGGLDPAAMRNATQAILRNAKIQVQLIEDLFDVSRVITGNMRLDVRPMNVLAPLEAALDTVRPAAAGKRIRLDAALDPRAAPIMGDPARIQQVVWNLLINAVKFTPSGGRVQLHLTRANSNIEIIVSDTGDGIASDQIEHVFERFRQVDTGPTRRHTGLGIGLSLVKHLVELHGGTVGVVSAGLGHGSTFTVRLPISVVQGPPPSTPGTKENQPGEDTGIESVKPVSLRDVRVLVVDDDPEGRELAGLVLTNAGAEIRHAASARAAMAILEEWPPDVLVSDLEMPEEDGFSLLRRARRASMLRGRKLPALALTAYGRSSDRVRVLAAGFNLHMAKPADPTELVLAIASLVGRTE